MQWIMVRGCGCIDGRGRSAADAAQQFLCGSRERRRAQPIGVLSVSLGWIEHARLVRRRVLVRLLIFTEAKHFLEDIAMVVTGELAA